MAAHYFSGNCVLGQRYTEAYWDQNSLDKSSFNRHLHRLADTLAGLSATFGALLKELHPESRYGIDSFPVAVCHKMRIKHLGPAFPAANC